MVVLRTIITAFAMFSALPVPQTEWNRENLRFSLCAFPLVGAVIGGACWLFSLICDTLALPVFLRGAGPLYPGCFGLDNLMVILYFPAGTSSGIAALNHSERH